MIRASLLMELLCEGPMALTGIMELLDVDQVDPLYGSAKAALQDLQWFLEHELVVFDGGLWALTFTTGSVGLGNFTLLVGDLENGCGLAKAIERISTLKWTVEPKNSPGALPAYRTHTEFVTAIGSWYRGSNRPTIA